MKNQPINWIQLGIGILLGAFIGYLFANRDVLTIEPTISAGGILRSITTIVSAIFVAAYLRNYFDGFRKEKEIILDQFDSILKLVSEIEDWQDAENLVKVTSQLKRLSKRCQFVHKSISSLNYSSQISGKCDFQPKIAKLRKLATYTPSHSEQNIANASVENGVIFWNQLLRQEIDLVLDSLKSGIFNAQMIFNKS